MDLPDAAAPATADSRNDWKHWLGLLGLAFALLVVWQLPYLNWLVYPFRLFGTFVHGSSAGIQSFPK